MDVVLVPGDGIGPEVTSAARRVVDETGAGVTWVDAVVGERAYAQTGTALAAEVLAEIRRCGVALKGPLANPYRADAYPSPNMTLRRELDLFVNVRLCRDVVRRPAGQPTTDVVVIREMTEGALTGSEQMVGPDAAVAVNHVSRAATERVARFACAWATAQSRKRLTVVHKASALRYVDGLFLATALGVAAGFPALDAGEMMVDTAAMYLVRDPGTFDVILTSLQYGDILSDICAGSIGGPGLVPGATYGDEVAFFESVHGTAPRYAGRNRANPTGMILAAAMLLRHLGHHQAAQRVDSAVRTVVRAGQSVTADLHGEASTEQMTDAIVDQLQTGPAD